MTTLHRSDFIPILDPFTELDLLPTYEKFPYNICDGCSMLSGDAYSSGHLVPSHIGLAYVLLVETNPFPELVFFLDYSLRTFLGTFSILLINAVPPSLCGGPGSKKIGSPYLQENGSSTPGLLHSGFDLCSWINLIA